MEILILSRHLQLNQLRVFATLLTCRSTDGSFIWTWTSSWWLSGRRFSGWRFSGRWLRSTRGPAVGAGPLDVHVLFLLLQVQFSAATHPFLFPLKVLQTTGTGAEVGTSVRRGWCQCWWYSRICCGGLGRL